ncbi:melanocyte-stimulating hormone receptor-like [Oculina patagonica]
MTNESEIMGNSFRPETIVIINCVLNVPLMIISIIGNTLVLAAILRTPSLRSPSTVLLCSLALSDLLAGFVVQPIYIASELTENTLLIQVLTVMSFSACGVSLSTMTAISVDRFLALHYHMRYPNLMTTHRAMYISITLWLLTFLLSFLSFWNINAYYFAAASSIVLCLIISTFCYIRIYRIVCRHQLQIHAQQQAVESFNAENNQNLKRSTKSAKNAFIFYIAMILCYTPLFINMTMLGISHKELENAWNLTDTLAFMNSSINPFLYCWRLRELRTAVLKTIKQLLCKQTEEN